MRISDWSSDVCSSDLYRPRPAIVTQRDIRFPHAGDQFVAQLLRRAGFGEIISDQRQFPESDISAVERRDPIGIEGGDHGRSEEHTSELQSLMRISYDVVCLNTKQENT